MKPSTRNLLSALLVILGVVFYDMMRPVGQPPGILAPDPPKVTAAPEEPPVFERDGHVLTGLAEFEAKARVVSIERYGRDRQAQIAPLDIALGWGKLSDTGTFKAVDVAQTERKLIFESYDPKLPKEVVAESLLNLHVIGADADMDKRLHDLRRGNIVQIQGWLVEAKAGDGWRWKGEPRAVAPTMPGSVLWVQSLEAH
jgi:hypothetical protein